MNRLRQPMALLIFAAVLAGTLGGGTELSPEVLLLSRIKRAAREGLSQIPAYVCDETVERYSRGSRLSRFSKKDQFRVQVAQIGDRELFARPGDKQFQDQPLSEMVRGGMTATGLFYTMAYSVFLSSATIFTYRGPEKHGGHATVRYDYRIAQMFSNYQVASNGYAAIVGMEGSVWADPNTYEPLQLDVRAPVLPPQMLLRSTATSINYNTTRMDEHFYLLPSSAVITTTTLHGEEDQNRTVFRDCHRYAGESKITF